METMVCCENRIPGCKVITFPGRLSDADAYSHPRVRKVKYLVRIRKLWEQLALQAISRNKRVTEEAVVGQRADGRNHHDG